MTKKCAKFKKLNAKREKKKRRNTKRNQWRECEERKPFLLMLQMKKVVLTIRKMTMPNIIEVKLDRNQKKVVLCLSFQLNCAVKLSTFSTIADLFTTRVRSAKSSLSGPAAKRAKIEKKKYAEKDAKQSKAGKMGGFKKNREDGDREFRRKGFKPGQRNDKPFASKQKTGGKPGFKGASKIQGKSRKSQKSRK